MGSSLEPLEEGGLAINLILIQYTDFGLFYSINIENKFMFIKPQSL